MTAYLEEKLGEDVAQKVAQDVQTIAPGSTPDQIRRLWGERKGGKFRTATYGLGTWLLHDAARAELDKPKDKDKEKAAAEAEKGTAADARKKLEERIKRYLDNQKVVRDSSGKVDDSEDPQKFWEQWNWAGKAQWVLAYYAEKSGDFRDLQPRFENCRECGGRGARDVLFTGNAASAQDGSNPLSLSGSLSS